MMELAITQHGIITWGTLTPWSEIQNIVLANDPAVIVDGLEIVPGSRKITFELVTGDFIEVAEGTPNWQAIIDQLPRCVGLRESGLAQILTTAQSADVLLWSQENIA